MRRRNFFGQTDSADSAEIFPFVGVEPLLLGMTKAEMLRVMGRQDNADPRATAGFEEDETFEYAEFGVDLSIDADSFWRLCTITLWSPRFHYRGNTLIGICEEELNELVSSGILGAIEIDEIDLGELGESDGICKTYDCASLGLSFWIEKGVVENCTMFSQYDPSGEIYMWPAVGED